MRCEFIMKQSKHYPIYHLCRICNVSRAGYYEWLNRPKSKRSLENEFLTTKITNSWNNSIQTYGAIRIKKDLEDQQIFINEKRVARLMKKQGIKSVYRAKYRVQTTDSCHDYPIAKNVIEQDFSAESQDQKWGCDISYIPTSEGFLYLAIVLDFYSKRVVGFAMQDTMKKELCIAALKTAFLRRKSPKNIIHHSDRGSQYASYEYGDLLRKNGCIQSMSRKGNCYDNAVVES